MTRIRVKKGSAAQVILRHMKTARGTLIRASDFPHLNASAASRALSRLADLEVIQRVSKGLYYAPKRTLLGPSQPSRLAVDMSKLSDEARPTRGTAAYMLGLSTQVPARPEYVVMRSATPSNLGAAVFHLRDIKTPVKLTPLEGAWIEVIRDRAKFSELPPNETVDKVLAHLKQCAVSKKKPDKPIVTNSIRRIAKAARFEPAGSRAIVGALLQHIGVPVPIWEPLKDSLNPHSLFDFGIFSALSHSKSWQCR